MKGRCNFSINAVFNTATENTDTHVDSDAGVGTHRMYRQGVGCIRGSCRKEMKSILFRETRI